ncbi:MAG: hypothetical protein JWN48_1562 [Myxococcaceae bacterium]|nr:hypothetical protein [Myxococcaceae bacterium]
MVALVVQLAFPPARMKTTATEPTRVALRASLMMESEVPQPRRAGSDHEVLVNHQSRAGDSVTSIRGVMIVSSLRMLQELGYYERYLTLLADQARATLPYVLAQSWVPIELACTHYAACEALDLGESELTSLGEKIANRNADAFYGTLLRSARRGGMDAAWLALGAQARIYDRMYVGGSVAVLRTGPKDAVVELSGLPLAAYRYFRVAYCGYMRGLASTLLDRYYVCLTTPRQPQAHSVALAGSWV